MTSQDAENPGIADIPMSTSAAPSPEAKAQRHPESVDRVQALFEAHFQEKITLLRHAEFSGDRNIVDYFQIRYDQIVPHSQHFQTRSKMLQGV